MKESQPGFNNFRSPENMLGRGVLATGNDIVLTLISMRRQMPLSQTTFARTAGLSQQSVSFLERSSKPNPELNTLFQYTRAIDSELSIALVVSAHEPVTLAFGSEIVSTLASIRREKKISQADLAIRAGRSQSIIADLEVNKKNTRLRSLIHYAKAVDPRLDIALFDSRV